MQEQCRPIDEFNKAWRGPTTRLGELAHLHVNRINSAQVLGDEILKYPRSHNESRFLRIHALSAGDGLTVARSLGHVQRSLQRLEDAGSESDEQSPGRAFVLQLYRS